MKKRSEIPFKATAKSAVKWRNHHGEVVLLGVQKHFSIVLCRIYRRTSQNRLPCSCFSIDNYYRFRADNWIVSSFSLKRGDASLERRALFWHSPYKSFAMAVFPANIQAKNFYLQKLRRILRVRTQNYLTCNCHFTSSPSLFLKRATAKGASSSRQLKFKRVEAKGLLIVSCSRLKYVKIGTIWATIWGVNMVSEVVTNLVSPSWQPRDTDPTKQYNFMRRRPLPIDRWPSLPINKIYIYIQWSVSVNENTTKC